MQQTKTKRQNRHRDCANGHVVTWQGSTGHKRLEGHCLNCGTLIEGRVTFHGTVRVEK